MKFLSILNCTLILPVLLFASLAQANPARLNFQSTPKIPSTDYKKMLAEKLLLSRINFSEASFFDRIDVINVQRNYDLLMFGLSTEKEKLISDFENKNFVPLNCYHINQSSVPEESEDLAAYEDFCVFPGSKLIFVNLNGSTPADIEIRDLVD